MALGKSTASMILGIMECVFNIIALIVAIPHGVMAIGYSMIVSSAFNCLIYFIYLKKISNFKVFKCILNSFKTYIASIIMGTIVFFIGTMSLPYYLLLFVQVLIGVALYYLLSKLFRNDALEYCLGLIKKLVKKG